VRFCGDFFSVSPRRAHRARQRGTPKRPQEKINEKRLLKFQRRIHSQVLSTRPRTQSGLTTGGPALPILQGEVSARDLPLAADLVADLKTLVVRNV
jgi:hypothetical protein